MTADCKVCGPGIRTGRTKSKGRTDPIFCLEGHSQSSRRYWQIKTGRVNPAQPYHTITGVDTESMVGTCSIDGPGTRVYQPKDNGTFLCTTRRRNYWLQHKYGLTSEQFDNMLQRQGNRCAICGISFKETKPCVDHEHHSLFRVRGLLCGPCNRQLGILENVAWTADAMLYLKRWEVEVI